MISVEQAIASVLKGAAPLGSEIVSIGDVAGRIAAEDIRARMTQPPFAASAMDGYAVRFADMGAGTRLSVIGEAPAGAPFAGAVGAGEAVRIFTGAVVPPGADHVVIQEDVTRDGDAITINEPQAAPRHIRPAGIDFKEGDVLASAGARLHEMHGSILAAANISEVAMRRRPVVALFSNGDELVDPGTALQPGQIVNSNHYALGAMVARWGGEARYLGRASDDAAAIRAFFAQAREADIIVPIGGASVGDYDFVKSAFKAEGGEIFFEKVAVRPGKPTWHGRLGKARVIGLPGNPASAIVTAALFVQTLTRALAGEATGEGLRTTRAVVTAPLGANGQRETFIRAAAAQASEGLAVTPAANQDSSLLSPFASANALIRRLPGAPAIDAGGAVDVIWLR